MIHYVFIGAAKAAVATVHAIHGAIAAHIGTAAHRELAKQGGKLAAKSLTSGGSHAFTGAVAVAPPPAHLAHQSITSMSAGTTLVAGAEGFAQQIGKHD
jgi:hypothetical protein